MERTVIKIDETLCNGCGNCVQGCHEGALQLIEGKAVMISDLYCDGLGACIGECPVGAITFEKREAAPYDEVAVMERLVPKGEAAVLAHLKHLKDHDETEWVRQGATFLTELGIDDIDLSKIGLDAGGNSVAALHVKAPRPEFRPSGGGCPGAMAREIRRPQHGGFAVAPGGGQQAAQPSELRQFPVQLHLVNPHAGFLRNADLLLAADCTAFASGEFHSRFLKGRILAIACPKLDGNMQVYVDKLVEMIDAAGINTLTVLVMEVPCCKGLVRVAQLARETAERNVPVKVVVLSVGGEVLGEEWV